MRGRPNSWSGVGEAYAASYAQLCAGAGPALREALGVGAGRRLLDVGSGTGELAAAFIADGWVVDACEPEPSMREVASRRHPSLHVRGDALPALPDADRSFEAVTANFVLNHVPDPRAAAAELLRVTRGTTAATVWIQSPSWLWAEVCERAGLAAAAGARLPAEKDFERTPTGFASMLRDAGWPDPQVREIRWIWYATEAALWASIEGGVAGAGAFYRGLDEADRDRFRRAFQTVVSERSRDGALALEHVAALAVSRREPDA